MAINKKSHSILFVSVAAILLSGCAAPKVRVQPSDNIYISEHQTGLVAGLRRTQDARPDADRSSDEKNDRPRDLVTSEQLYKNIKLSGAFKDVLFDKFADEQVDVVITPRLKRFSSGVSVGGKTAAAMGIALIPIVNIVYLAAGGPISEQVAVVDIDLELKTKVLTRTVNAAKTAEVTRYLGEDPTLKTGQLEGDTLSDVIRELLNKAAEALAPARQP